MPMGESDRLLTILTREHGLVRAVAMGARKHNSRLGGRSGLFVVNELLIAKGRSLDKVTQAETLESYPKLGQDLKKLTASQYLAEICLYQALSQQPQEELFLLLNEHLKRIEQAPSSWVVAHLTQAVFQLLILGGVAPQVHFCCMTQQPICPNLADPDWQTGFSIAAGGAITLPELGKLQAEQPRRRAQIQTGDRAPSSTGSSLSTLAQPTAARLTQSRNVDALNLSIPAAQVVLLQHLAQPELPDAATLLPLSLIQYSISTNAEKLWCSIERILRHYAQYHLDRPIRSATLIDACFDPADPS